MKVLLILFFAIVFYTACCSSYYVCPYESKCQIQWHKPGENSQICHILLKNDKIGNGCCKEDKHCHHQDDCIESVCNQSTNECENFWICPVQKMESALFRPKNAKYHCHVDADCDDKNVCTQDKCVLISHVKTFWGDDVSYACNYTASSSFSNPTCCNDYSDCAVLAFHDALCDTVNHQCMYKKRTDFKIGNFSELLATLKNNTMEMFLLYCLILEMLCICFISVTDCFKGKKEYEIIFYISFLITFSFLVFSLHIQ